MVPPFPPDPPPLVENTDPWQSGAIPLGDDEESFEANVGDADYLIQELNKIQTSVTENAILITNDIDLSDANETHLYRKVSEDGGAYLSFYGSVNISGGTSE